MKRALIITADYYPYPSSNTNCFEPLLDKLEQNSFKVDIVTRRLNRRDLPYEKKRNNINVYRINDTRTINTFKVNEWASAASSQIGKLFKKLMAFFSKSIFYLVFCLFREEKRFSGWNTKSAVKKCLSLHADKNYDLIISISYPFLSHEIASKVIELTNNKPKWIWMEYDPFCYNEYLYGKGSFERLYPIQLKCFEMCDLVITTPELLPLYRKQAEFSKVVKKITAISYANLKVVSIDKENAVHIEMKNNRINCIFAGALGDEIRNPKYLLSVFSELASDLHLIIMTGSRPDFFDKEIALARDAVTLYLSQTRDTAYLAMTNSDILINIGNLVSFQTPGKIFEYMAMGKPIIHFSSIENDSSIKYIKDYPMVLIIKEDEKNVTKHRQEIRDFCIKYSGKVLTFEKVIDAVPHLASEYVANDFLNLVNKVIDVDGQ